MRPSWRQYLLGMWRTSRPAGFSLFVCLTFCLFFTCTERTTRTQECKFCFNDYLSHYYCYLIFWEGTLYFKTTMTPDHENTVTAPLYGSSFSPHSGSGSQATEEQGLTSRRASFAQTLGSMSSAHSDFVCYSRPLAVCIRQQLFPRCQHHRILIMRSILCSKALLGTQKHEAATNLAQHLPCPIRVNRRQRWKEGRNIQ